MEHGLIEYGGCDVFYTVLLLGGRKGWQETMVWNVVVWYCWFVYSDQCGKVGMVNESWYGKWLYGTVGTVQLSGTCHYMVWKWWYGRWCGRRGGKGGRRPAQTNLPTTLVIPRPSSPLLVNIIFIIVNFICNLCC